jgi:uncharacterized membrane protein YfcA
MLDSLWIILPMATVLGFLSGLGTGGGSLLILWLTLIQQMPQQEARAINLLFFLPAALAACIFHKRQGSLPLKKVMPAIIAGSISTGVFTVWASGQEHSVMKKLFGILLVITGLRELFYRPRKAR